MVSFGSLPPLPPLEPAMVLQARSVVSQAADQRVALSACALSSPAPPLRPLGPPGTAENPLIPKRRRRTSPQEQKLLENEFKKNPLPSQAERNRIAERVGMSGRVSGPDWSFARAPRAVGGVTSDGARGWDEQNS